jgi:hypothetical protein
MPISYAQVNTILSERLDDELSQRYSTENRLAAINSGIGRAQFALGYMLANRKGSEEALKDFTKVGIWQTDPFGAALLDDPLLGYTIANVMGLYAVPDLQAPASILPVTGSQYRPDVLWAGAGEPVRRVTLEQVGVIKTNAMMPGNEVLAAIPGRRSWAYYLADGKAWLLPKSQAGETFVAISHIEKFAPMTTITDTVNLPEFMLETLASWAYSYITWKQGDRGPMGALAMSDANELFGFQTT